MTQPNGATRIPLNTLAISFGTAGLASMWTSAGKALGLPDWPADTAWVIAAVVWVWLIVAHTVRGRASADTLVGQLQHPAQGPIAAIVPVVGMMLGAHLFLYWPVGGMVVALTSMAVTALYAGWLLAYWVTGTIEIDSVHGAFFLPTVAGTLIAAAVAADLGFASLAMGAFAVGVFFWGVIFALILARLIFRPALPAPLIPTLAILVAPPAVAGNAWFAIVGHSMDAVQDAFAASAVLLGLMQLALLPTYMRLKFSLGFWSFTFPAAALVGYAVGWLGIVRPWGWQVIAAAALALATGLIVAIAVASVRLAIASGRDRRRSAADELRDADSEIESDAVWTS
ncbi:transporter [Conyzicola nivalis]|nr:transporter [Conyzicola nivalis]